MGECVNSRRAFPIFRQVDKKSALDLGNIFSASTHCLDGGIRELGTILRYHVSNDAFAHVYFGVHVDRLIPLLLFWPASDIRFRSSADQIC